MTISSFVWWLPNSNVASNVPLEVAAVALCINPQGTATLPRFILKVDVRLLYVVSQTASLVVDILF